MKCVYFVEIDNPSVDLSDGDVIALTPCACESLRRRGVSYTIVEDYYSEKELRADEEGYLREQLRWFQKIDSFLKEKISFCRKNNINLAMAHRNRITFLVDSFVIRSYILEQFLKKKNPTEVRVLASKVTGNQQPSIYNFKRKDRCSYPLLLKAIVDKKYKHISVVWLEGDSSISSSLNQSGEQIANSGFQKVFKALRFTLKSANHFFKYKKIRRIVSLFSDSSRKSVMFLDRGAATVDEVIKEYIRRGWRVYFKERGRVSSLSSAVEKEGKILGVDLLLQEVVAQECEVAAGKLDESGIFEWFNQAVCFDASFFIRPYFEHFLREICPQVILETRFLMDFFKQNSISAVIARSSTGENYVSALLAAERLKIPRVCFQHSTGPVDMKSWVLDELYYFDYNYAISTPAAHYFQNQAASASEFRCSVGECSYYLNEIKRNYRSKKTKKPYLIYCPTRLSFDGAIQLNSVFYQRVWHYKLQQQILLALSKHSEITVVYKQLNNQDWIYKSMVPWMKDLNIRNVCLETEPFVNYLDEAERVLFDFPSTGLFEAAAASVPVMSLYHESAKVWPPMFDIFGKSLQSFLTIDDALKKVSIFLSASKDDYKVDLPLLDSNNWDFLNNINYSSLTV